MTVLEQTITPKGKTHDDVLSQEIIRLYENEPDLRDLPGLLFDGVGRLIDAEVVAYAEFHYPSRDFRALVSVGDDPEARAKGMAAFSRHMHSHPFWLGDPRFFGERALRESDFFDEQTYLGLPMVREVFLPSRARRIISIVIENEGYVVRLSGYRVLGRPAFSDSDRDRLEAFRPHLLRSYRHAQQRTLSNLSPGDRLRYAFPELTARQVEVASWLAEGKSNEDIAAIIDVGIDTVKAHVKALYSKLGADGRLAVAVIAHTIPPFGRLPPLWKLTSEAWGARTRPKAGQPAD